MRPSLHGTCCLSLRAIHHKGWNRRRGSASPSRTDECVRRYTGLAGFRLEAFTTKDGIVDGARLRHRGRTIWLRSEHAASVATCGFALVFRLRGIHHKGWNRRRGSASPWDRQLFDAQSTCVRRYTGLAVFRLEPFTTKDGIVDGARLRLWGRTIWLRSEHAASVDKWALLSFA